MLLHNKDDSEFVPEFPYLCHPVHMVAQENAQGNKTLLTRKVPKYYYYTELLKILEEQTI